MWIENVQRVFTRPAPNIVAGNTVALKVSLSLLASAAFVSEGKFPSAKQRIFSIFQPKHFASEANDACVRAKAKKCFGNNASATMFYSFAGCLCKITRR